MLTAGDLKRILTSLPDEVKIHGFKQLEKFIADLPDDTKVGIDVFGWTIYKDPPEPRTRITVYHDIG